MSILAKLKQLFQGKPMSPEDAEEARRLRDQMETARLSQRSGSAGENYESGRGPGGT
jgi:hypothetical protein